MYHLSDLPSFVSTRYIVFFDPHCKFLPRANASNPGKRIDFVASRALETSKDQFTPYRAFGCDMERPFEGTLFRLPLRTPQQAQHSKLSRQAYTADDMAALLTTFQARSLPPPPLLSLALSFLFPRSGSYGLPCTMLPGLLETPGW